MNEHTWRQRRIQSTGRPPSGDAGPVTPHEDGAVIEALASSPIQDCRLVPWGSNCTFAVTLIIDDHTIIGIYKPRAGETPLWDFPSGTLYRREYASYLLSRALGWGFIPPTVVRDGPHGVGTVQLYIEPGQPLHDDAVRGRFAAELQCIFIFDLITNNADRKQSHLFVDAENRQIWGIDHGLTFHVHPKLRTVIWEFCGRPAIPELLRDVQDRLLAREESITALLAPYIEKAEIEAVFHRAGALVAGDTLPELNPRRNIPFGW